MKKINRSLQVLLVAAVSWSSCSKKDNNELSIDNSSITQVVADNFNLSVFTAALRYSGMDKTLKAPGNFTALAPSDAAFSTAGYPGTNLIYGAEAVLIARITNYHTLDGKYELNKLPYLFNQELRSRGGRMFATHWIKGTDTVLTINGARVLAQNLPASNGLIQVLNRVLTPYVHEQVGNAVAAEQDITLFAQALISSGLLTSINNSGPYTIFAPNNEAMLVFGYSTIQQVSETDPAILRRLINYHIARDRRFIYDYILSTGPSNASRQVMLDGNTVGIDLAEDPIEPGKFSTITLTGTGNTNAINLVKQNILAGNGVLHIIDGVLKITQ